MSTPERRDKYRVEDIDRYGLRANLVGPQKAEPVQLLDVSFIGVGFALSQPSDRTLRVDDVITLRFTADNLTKDVHVSGIVRSRQPTDKGTRYGIRFVDTREIQRYVPPRLIGAFNRRGAYRVSPDSAQEVQCQVDREGLNPVNLPVICISATGLACLATDESDGLKPGDSIRIQFQLPDANVPCVINGTLRYRKAQRGGIRYGIEFDIGGTPFFNRYQSMIQRYVMQQQRQMLNSQSST